MSRAEMECETTEDFVGAYEELFMSESPGVPVIAVVDDDESVRESLAGLAESVGYEAALFASGEEFLKSARHRNDLACLILDVRLPGMSGVELHTQLSAGGWFVPTILITAHADPALLGGHPKPAIGGHLIHLWPVFRCPPSGRSNRPLKGRRCPDRPRDCLIVSKRGHSLTRRIELGTERESLFQVFDEEAHFGRQSAAGRSNRKDGHSSFEGSQ
jgi:CheY-like chemotaxis protein